jgi:hypothetical protein
VWLESVPVHEVFRGETLWKGEVKVFDLNGHPKAKRAFGWSHPDGPVNKTERFVAVLEISPVDPPQSAVKVSIVSNTRSDTI